jgi:hypothetical protein
VNIDSMVPTKSSFLTKDDVGEQGRNLTIKGFVQKEIKNDNESEMRYVIEWIEPDFKPMVLNKENASRLKMIFKVADTDAMIGRPVNVYNDAFVTFAGKVTGGIRLRPATNVAPQAPRPRQAAPPPAAADEPWQPTAPPESYQEFDDKIPF